MALLLCYKHNKKFKKNKNRGMNSNTNGNTNMNAGMNHQNTTGGINFFDQNMANVMNSGNLGGPGGISFMPGLPGRGISNPSNAGFPASPSPPVPSPALNSNSNFHSYIPSPNLFPANNNTVSHLNLSGNLNMPIPPSYINI